MQLRTLCHIATGPALVEDLSVASTWLKASNLCTWTHRHVCTVFSHISAHLYVYMCYTYKWLVCISAHTRILVRHFQAPMGACSREFGIGMILCVCVCTCVHVRSRFLRCSILSLENCMLWCSQVWLLRLLRDRLSIFQNSIHVASISRKPVILSMDFSVSP